MNSEISTTIKWADTPFALLEIPGQSGAQTCENPGLLHIVAEMANAHNVLIRGLNALYNQAPFIRIPGDVSGLMLYIAAWADSVHHHHHLEETLFFPDVEAAAKEAGLAFDVQVNVEQHHDFEPKMADMLKRMVDSFASILVQHLHDEVGTLMVLEKCDGDKLRAAMKKVGETSAKTIDPYIVAPLILGCGDRGYPGSRGCPPVPFFLPWLNAYWFERKHSGSWRFNPSDHWGYPRPLHFQPHDL
ncbi:Hemerythrin domain containing protein [Pyrenophora teres f. teres]|uniref:Hemerythrin domain containing protein n=1 Tax=Pyrenophora teres f. teres TaxID=97479 RepID=A0A6S6W4C1_9PLEO|nr:Hemerythrin domain containing protein [Pyrenophora teres f. teres]